MEAIQRLEADPMGVKGYDSFVNIPSEPNARAVPGAIDVDPQKAAVARGRISNNNGTTNGQQGAVLTPGQKKTFETGSNADRLDLAGELNEKISVPQSVKIDSKSSNIQLAINDLTRQALSRTGQDVDEFTKTIDSLRTATKVFDSNNSVRYLSEEGMTVVSAAKRQLMDEYLRLNEVSYRRASAMINQSAAEDVTNAANAVRKMEDAYPVERQMEVLFDSLRLLTKEERTNRWIAGKSLSMLQDLQPFKAGTKEFAKAYEETLKDIPDTLNKIEVESFNLNATLRELGEKNPEFLKPFIKAYDMSNGDINTLMRLQDYASNRIGFLKKALVDTNPQVASQLVQELRALRYNSVLSGLAPIRAAVGNTMMLALKPVTTLAGSAVTKNGNFERALYTFGGIQENIQRAFKMMGEEWKYVRLNPDAAYARGRVDLDAARLDDLEAMDAMAEAWTKNGEKGKAALWKTSMLFHGFNNNGLVRYGIDAMYALDGFVKSMVASGSARASAYDELYVSGQKISKEAFDAKQRQVYSQAFDAENMPTDKAVKFAAGEMSLNIDNTVAQKVQDVIKYVPAAEAVFMFPRTGLNALEMAWSYAPVSGLGGALGRARKVFNAKTKEQMIEALKEHGIEEFSEEAFKAIKSEYVGRQLMGGLVVTGAATFALNGNLTGTGPADKGELRRMRAMGYQPQSIRNPITGEWHSYKGFEPFDSLMGLVGDVVYFANQNDSSFTEDTFRKISASISMNIASKSFISGFEPLVSLFSGDENSWSRFLAMQADSLIPGSGLRGAIGRVVNPQLKDVDSDFWQQMANRNKGWPNGLPNQLDVYTGEPIQGWNPMVDSINALLPFFKTNPGFEPWREWLINTGWDNLQTIRTNPLTGQPLTGDQRQWINNWIGTNGNLKTKIEKMSKDPFWLKAQQDYLDLKKTQSETPITESLLYQELNNIHNRAFKAAWAAYASDPDHTDQINQFKLLRQRNALLNRGNNQGAADSNRQIEELRQMPK